MTFKSNNRCRNSENKTKTETLAAAAMNVKRVIIRNVIRKHFTRKITLRSNSLKSFESRQNKFLKKKRLQSFVSILSPGNEPARHSRARKVKTKRKTLRALEKNISRSEAAQRQQQPCWCFGRKPVGQLFQFGAWSKINVVEKNYPWPDRIVEQINVSVLPVVQSIVSDQSILKLNLKGTTLSLKTNEKKLVH